MFDMSTLTAFRTQNEQMSIFRTRPRKKCDMNFHWNSMSFHITNWRQFGPNPRQIPWPFHVIYSGFIYFFMLKTWHGFWTSHGISMAFAKKKMGFPSDLISFSTKRPSKRHEKTPVTFFTGIDTSLYNIPL